MAQQATPNIDKLEAVIHSFGSDVSISWQLRTEGAAGGFFTVCRSAPEGAERYCSIGQADSLADAFRAEQADYKTLTAKISIADIEQAAA